ncbi:MAG: OB-fold nucleic acid binding domain-containing protein, partial [Candidatus Cryptobacteroides sp.]
MGGKESDNDIQFLPGVGPKRARLLKQELGISTFGEMVRLYPFRYIDRSRMTEIREVRSESAYIQIRARVLSSEIVGGKRLSVILDDGTGQIEAVFFKGIKWVSEKLKPGEEFIFFGKPSEFNGRINLVHPEIDPVSGGTSADKAQGTAQGLTGIYPSTEKLKNSGITAKVMAKIQAAALNAVLPEVRETLTEDIMKSRKLVPLQYALYNIHFPTGTDALEKARRRLKFEELFFLQLALLKQKYVRCRNSKGIPMPKVGDGFRECYNALPFDLTGAQKRVIKEIREDLKSGRQMNRLLQGDVG